MLACEEGLSALLEMFKDAPEGSVRVINTSFGASLVCYLGSDGFVHTLVPSDQVELMMKPWEHGPAHAISFQRFLEVTNMIADVRAQMLGTQTPQRPPIQRRISDVYDVDPKLERMLAGTNWEVDGFELSEEQQTAVKIILSDKRPVFILTGQAGSGKSAITRWLRENNLVTVCATTGRAAINIGGCTVDSLFCFTRGKWEVFNQFVLEKYMKSTHKIILIDEASMIGENMGNLLITLAERYDKKLVLVGDWAQAMPVKEDWGHCSRLFDDCAYFRLEECHRQDETEFLEVLNKVRIGIVDDQVSRELSSRVMPPPRENGWLRMYATNKMADNFNQQKLSEVCEQEGLFKLTFRSIFHDERPSHTQERHPRDENFKNKAMEESGFAHNTLLAVGAQVLITSNEPIEKAYVNGDVGTISDLTLSIDKKKIKEEDHYGEPMKWPPFMSWQDMDRQERERVSLLLLGGASSVKVLKLSVVLERTGGVVRVEPHKVTTVNGSGNAVHTVSGFPVRLGYAVTIHKAQGMTVDKAWLDMGSVKAMPESGRHGLAYVGLSRVRTLEGLGIGSWSPDVVVCSEEVLPLI